MLKSMRQQKKRGCGGKARKSPLRVATINIPRILFGRFRVYRIHAAATLGESGVASLAKQMMLLRRVPLLVQVQAQAWGFRL
jgi:hypothetical protein